MTKKKSKKERLRDVAITRKRDKHGRFLAYDKIEYRCRRCDIAVAKKGTWCKWCISEGYGNN